MITTRTPLRISFAGGGSDIPQYCDHYVGNVVSAAINYSVYISVGPRYDHKVRLAYSKTELVDDIDDLEHDIARETLRYFGIRNNIEIVSIADLPSGAGLGSSSAFTVGLVNALSAYMGIYRSPKELYTIASDIEMKRCNKPIGYQDQAASAFGGINSFEFHNNGWLGISSLLNAKNIRLLQDRLILVDTGIYGSSSQSLVSIDISDPTTIRKLHSIVSMAVAFHQSFINGNITDCGDILDSSWEVKRSLSDNVSSPTIDDMYAFAKQHGAIGGKLCGAGGRGMFMIITGTGKRNSLSYAIYDTFNLKNFLPQVSLEGSRVVYSDS